MQTSDVPTRTHPDALFDNAAVAAPFFGAGRFHGRFISSMSCIRSEEHTSTPSYTQRQCLLHIYTSVSSTNLAQNLPSAFPGLERPVFLEGRSAVGLVLDELCDVILVWAGRHESDTEGHETRLGARAFTDILTGTCRRHKPIQSPMFMFHRHGIQQVAGQRMTSIGQTHMIPQGRMSYGWRRSALAAELPQMGLLSGRLAPASDFVSFGLTFDVFTGLRESGQRFDSDSLE